MASKEALKLHQAHQLYKASIGTPDEAAALAFLKSLVRTLGAAREGGNRGA